MSFVRNEVNDDSVHTGCYCHGIHQDFVHMCYNVPRDYIVDKVHIVLMDYIVQRGYNDHNDDNVHKAYNGHNGHNVCIGCTVYKTYRTYKVYNDYKDYNEINKNRSSMIILFTNIKGGVGKTSTCALFAQYLYESGYPVTVLDADIQASLSRHRERELAANPDVTVPWEVSTIDTADRQSLMSSIEEVMKLEGIVLIDMPGTLNAVNLDLLYKVADLAVVPISYDFDTIDATGLFIKVVRKMKDIKMVFLPNRINSTENRADEMKQREETVKILGRIGKVTPRIKQSVVIKRYSTVSPLDKYQKAAVEHAFDAIVEQIKL